MKDPSSSGSVHWSRIFFGLWVLSLVVIVSLYTDLRIAHQHIIVLRGGPGADQSWVERKEEESARPVSIRIVTENGPPGLRRPARQPAPGSSYDYEEWLDSFELRMLALTRKWQRDPGRFRNSPDFESWGEDARHALAFTKTLLQDTVGEQPAKTLEAMRVRAQEVAASATAFLHAERLPLELSGK